MPVGLGGTVPVVLECGAACVPCGSGFVVSGASALEAALADAVDAAEDADAATVGVDVMLGVVVGDGSELRVAVQVATPPRTITSAITMVTGTASERFGVEGSCEIDIGSNGRDGSSCGGIDGWDAASAGRDPVG